jgi:hypothetical protein
MRPTGRLLLLCVLLCVWEPANLALSASGDLAAMTTDSVVRSVFLVFRVLVASVGVAAGMALWNDRDHAFTLAKTALTLSAAAAVVRFAWFPGNTPPGLRLPYALVFIGYNAAWFLYLTLTARRSKP